MYTKFQVTAAVNIPDEHGENKVKPQTYVVDAMSFIEAETRIREVLGSEIIDITAIKGVKFAEIYDGQKEFFFIVQFNELFIDEKTGKQKKAKFQCLVNANNIEEAKTLFIDHYLTMADFEITSIKQTNIIEYIPAKKDSDK